MKAVAGDLPVDEEGWAFEIKWDGMRVLAFADPRADERSSLRLVTTNGKDATASFPELRGLAAGLGGRAAVLDGEVVAFAETTAAGIARPDFGRLQQRMHVVNEAEARRRSVEVPVNLVVFDLLHLDDASLLTLPYLERRRILHQLLPDGPSWSVPKDWRGSGADLLDIADRNGLEGVVAKRVDSPYQPGRRSRAWRKVKVRRHQEFVVGGWTEGSGGRSGAIGALLLGVVADGAEAPAGTGEPLVLRYAGRVGTGFDAAELGRLARQFADLAAERSPFVDLPAEPALRSAHFLRPELVVEVAFGEWTGDGVLRHPSYLGRRIDKDPSEVRREPG